MALLAEAIRQIALLEGIGRNLPNPGLLLRPIEDREALQSSRLEGTYITAKEFLLFNLDDEEGENPGDWKEVVNYRRALQFGINSRQSTHLQTVTVGSADYSSVDVSSALWPDQTLALSE